MRVLLEYPRPEDEEVLRISEIWVHALPPVCLVYVKSAAPIYLEMDSYGKADDALELCLWVDYEPSEYWLATHGISKDVAKHAMALVKLVPENEGEKELLEGVRVFTSQCVGELTMLIVPSDLLEGIHAAGAISVIAPGFRREPGLLGLPRCPHCGKTLDHVLNIVRSKHTYSFDGKIPRLLEEDIEENLWLCPHCRGKLKYDIVEKLVNSWVKKYE